MSIADFKKKLGIKAGRAAVIENEDFNNFTGRSLMEPAKQPKDGLKQKDIARRGFFHYKFAIPAPGGAAI